MSRSSQALLHEYTQRLIEVLELLHAHTTASQYDHKIRQKGHCYELGRVSQKQMSACVAAFLCWIGGNVMTPGSRLTLNIIFLVTWSTQCWRTAHTLRVEHSCRQQLE